MSVSCTYTSAIYTANNFWMFDHTPPSPTLYTSHHSPDLSKLPQLFQFSQLYSSASWKLSKKYGHISIVMWYDFWFARYYYTEIDFGVSSKEKHQKFVSFFDAAHIYSFTMWSGSYWSAGINKERYSGVRCLIECDNLEWNFVQIWLMNSYLSGFSESWNTNSI